MEKKETEKKIPKYITQFNPSTGLELGKVKLINESEIPNIMKVAKKVQKKWSQLSFSTRRTHITSIKKSLFKNRNEIVNAITLSTGKTPTEAITSELLPCMLACDWYSKNAESILSSKKISSGSILFANKHNDIHYLPLGVVGIISPWNFPFNIPFGEIIMGLMAGNAIILKTGSNVSYVGKVIEKIINESSLPKGLFHHIIISGSKCVESLLKNGINKIFFTGSVSVGKKIMGECAKYLIPVSLELGGNDPMIVLNDADIERATNCVCYAGFMNCGQVCAGIERIYVQEKIYDRFISILSKKVKKMRHGPSIQFDKLNIEKKLKNVKNEEDFSKFASKLKLIQTDVEIGCLTTKNQLKTVQSHLKDALDNGAKILAQSSPLDSPMFEKYKNKGFYFPATVLINVNHSMECMKNETFGPIVSVMKFKTIEEVIKFANNSDLALTSSVFTSNKKLGDEIALKIESGVTTINDHLYTQALSSTPWGGKKHSGIGRTHGEMGLKEMCTSKLIGKDYLDVLPRSFYWQPYSEGIYTAAENLMKYLSGEGVQGLIALFLALPFILKNQLFGWEFKGNESANQYLIKICNIAAVWSIYIGFIVSIILGMIYLLITYFN